MWQVKQMTGFRFTHTRLIVTDPSCPEGRHPTRDCGCRTFNNDRAAQAYADARNGICPACQVRLSSIGVCLECGDDPLTNIKEATHEPA